MSDVSRVPPQPASAPPAAVPPVPTGPHPSLVAIMAARAARRGTAPSADRPAVDPMPVVLLVR